MSLHFLDSNIVMYSLGSSHPLKTPCMRILEKIRSSRIQVCTNTEVFQEILYRYYSLDKKELAYKACKLLEDITDPVLSVSQEDVTKAIALLKQYPINVRDAVHAATMLNHNIRHIISTDIHFDQIPVIKRIQP